jgi:hypothetical protein
MASDLHALLQAAGIPPPYVLVGHSLGGVIARRFQADYPDTVAGMLLIDSSHEDHPRRLGAVDWREGTVGILKSAARRQARIVGAPRLAVALGLTPGLAADMARTAPREYAGAARAMSLSLRQNQAMVRELLVLAHSWGQPSTLGSLPLVVLTACRRPWRGWPVWVQMQDELAALSSDSEHVVHAKRAMIFTSTSRTSSFKRSAPWSGAVGRPSVMLNWPNLKLVPQGARRRAEPRSRWTSTSGADYMRYTF